MHIDRYFGRDPIPELWHAPLKFHPYITPEGLQDGSYAEYKNGTEEQGMIHILLDRFQARWYLNGNDICFTRAIVSPNPNGINPFSIRFNSLDATEITDHSINVLVVCDPREKQYQDIFYIDSPQNNRIVYIVTFDGADFLIQPHTSRSKNKEDHAGGEVLRIYKTEQKPPFVVIHTPHKVNSLGSRKETITRFPTTLLQAHGQVATYNLFDTMIRSYTGALQGKNTKTNTKLTSIRYLI